MYSLYYLADQAGPIDGDKEIQGKFSSFEDAKSQADCDGVEHYSIERDLDSGAGVEIVYVV